MFISDFAIRRPIVTVVTMIALVVFGAAALAKLDTDEFPAIDAPIVFVAIAYPGAAPDVVEREVVTRIEDKISGISGVDKINSTSTDGFAQIIVQFVFSKPVDQATQDIRDAISAVRAQLPAEIIEPIIQRFDPNQLPIVSLALTSSVLSPPQLTQIADQTIAGELRAIAGVAQVNVVGGDSAQLNVNVRPNDLAALGVGIDQVVDGAPRAEPRGAGRQREQRARAAVDPARRAARPAGGFFRARHLRAKRTARHARSGGRRRGGRRRAAVGRVLQRTAGDRPRHREVARVQHDGRGRSA